MHHHLFPTEDTYLTNLSGFEDKNFGLNEIVRIGTDSKNIRAVQATKNFSYLNVVWISYCTENFTGTVSGSFQGIAAVANGLLSSNTFFTTSYFTSSYFSGSIDGGPIVEFSGSRTGSMSGSITGTITGSINSDVIFRFSGSLTGSDAIISGLVTGTDTRAFSHWVTTSKKYVDRTIIKFNLDAISSSIASGEILPPEFKLNLKVSNEYQLPISYKIYAYPVSQSWTMGNGYYSDGGSDTGVSWFYKDQASGEPWYAPITTSLRPVVDFLNTESTASFAYGGGTWYYSASAASMKATQSFSYESADIEMDVTHIVKAWLSGSIPNNGFILMSSDEIVSSGSGYSLSFYGKDTNSINSPYLDIMWDNWSWDSGSVGTSSVVITSSYSGMTTTVQSGSTFTITGGISGSFSASVFFTTSSGLDAIYNYFEALVLGAGLTGNIIGLPVIGTVSGSITINTSSVAGICGAVFDAHQVSGSFLTGIWSGSTFTAFYVDNKFENAFLTGSWPAALLVGAHVNIPLPSGIDPYAYAYVSGPYMNGKAFGPYTILNSTSASFSGVFIDGPLVGGYLSLQLSGSVSTASFSYTSSMETTSSIFTPLDTNRQFTVIIKNLHPTYKGGDIIRVNVFGRREFPTKTFAKSSQQVGYLVPELLPSSSYYAIKDNMSEEIVVDFDNYTRISCEHPEGNFFLLDTTGLAQERPYRILVRVENSGSKYTFDNGDVFKITR
jgi:hypothetical protein